MSMMTERVIASAELKTAPIDPETQGASACESTDVSSQTEASWQRACRVDELEPLWGEAAILVETQIALVLISPAEIYAVSHQDPHTGSFVMARGIVGSRGERPTLASPLHKEVYDLGTGECFTRPELSLKTFPTRVIDGFIEVKLGLA